MRSYRDIYIFLHICIFILKFNLTIYAQNQKSSITWPKTFKSTRSKTFKVLKPTLRLSVPFHFLSISTVASIRNERRTERRIGHRWKRERTRTSVICEAFIPRDCCIYFYVPSSRGVVQWREEKARKKKIKKKGKKSERMRYERATSERRLFDVSWIISSFRRVCSPATKFRAFAKSHARAWKEKYSSVEERYKFWNYLSSESTRIFKIQQINIDTMEIYKCINKFNREYILK